MALSEQQMREYALRLMQSRARILCTHGFYGLLLMHMKYELDTEAPTAYTTGDVIAFSPKFMDELSDGELDFVMMHEILHVVLQHCSRYVPESMDMDDWNIACDIVVNSNILNSNNMDPASISLAVFGGEAMHLTPNGKEGFLFTMEEVYHMVRNTQKKPINGPGNKADGKKRKWKREDVLDDHSKWKREDVDPAEQEAKWEQRMRDAAEVMRVLEASNSRGTVPAGAQRLLDELRKPRLDWRQILNEFVQEEITDYSFSPPDRRFSESEFFLPDFNETEEFLGNVLFMVDTSGSVNDKMIVEAYSEVCGAIEQFGGKLGGMLGFFDAKVYGPTPFEKVEDVKAIRPRGGGGTSFDVVFEAVRKSMENGEDPPVSIIILTDGYAPFPAEQVACGIPVLWVINGSDVQPPWGRVAHLP